MDKVDLTLGHIRASKGIRDGNIVNASVEGLGDLRVQRPVPAEALPLFPSAPFNVASAAPAPAPAGTPLNGSYRRKSGRELRYTYCGSYWRGPEGTAWMVTVRCNRRLRGTFTGTSYSAASPSESDLRALIERSIEELAHIEE
jgi:hypothetical protein